MLSFTSSVILPSSGVVKSSGKCRKKVAESFGFCFVDSLFVSHFPTNETKALEKLLKDHAGKYVTGDEVSMANLFLAPQILAGIERFNVDMLLLDFLSFSAFSFSSMARYLVVTDKVSMEVVEEFILEQLNLTKGTISEIKDNLETLLQEDIQADLVCCLQHLQLRFETEDKARRLLK
ncbi:hypothetical protein ES332_D04G100500v1 [Gossypium tomentosum]|uniref:Uncharacterized protein n=1 Tax=Gossypium tomentosum TaxID=34277 RepID=A0A5D2LC76_GOSTO|nr:hypothetical protein ES332_D04G100500v1 [Gossypium tomentosum]